MATNPITFITIYILMSIVTFFLTKKAYPELWDDDSDLQSDLVLGTMCLVFWWVVFPIDVIVLIYDQLTHR